MLYEQLGRTLIRTKEGVRTEGASILPSLTHSLMLGNTVVIYMLLLLLCVAVGSVNSLTGLSVTFVLYLSLLSILLIKTFSGKRVMETAS